MRKEGEGSEGRGNREGKRGGRERGGRKEEGVVGEGGKEGSAWKCGNKATHGRVSTPAMARLVWHIIQIMASLLVNSL